jgi:hypothetical protein
MAEGIFAAMPVEIFAARPVGLALGTDPASMPIAAALITYCMLHLVPAIVNGTPRRDAASSGWDLLRRSRLLTRDGAVLDPDERHSTRCVATVCEALLDDPWKLPKERMLVGVDLCRDALVAIDLVRRLMLGEQPGNALRNAIDGEAGRSSRRRAPLPDTEVLAFTTALQAKLKRSLDQVGAL